MTDLVTAHLAALERLLVGGDSFVCNLGSGTGSKVREILNAVAEVVGYPVPYDKHPRRPGDATTLLSDTKAAKCLLGLDSRHLTLEQFIGDPWRFHRRRFGTGRDRKLTTS